MKALLGFHIPFRCLVSYWNSCKVAFPTGVTLKVFHTQNEFISHCNLLAFSPSAQEQGKPMRCNLGQIEPNNIKVSFHIPFRLRPRIDLFWGCDSGTEGRPLRSRITPIIVQKSKKLKHKNRGAA